MGLKIQIFAAVGALGLLLIVLEMVRQRRLLERYALLWILSATVLFALAAWRGLLTALAHMVGIYYPPSALFVVALGFTLLLLLHFSLAVSKLSERTKVLAQRLALADQKIAELERAAADQSLSVR